MNHALLKVLFALLPVGMLFWGAFVLFVRLKTVGTLLQLLGAGCFVVVVITHVCEVLGLISWMQWGKEHSAGHYLDLYSALLGLTLFPVGYLLHSLKK
jgi:hypothetical protein